MTETEKLLAEKLRQIGTPYAAAMAEAEARQASLAKPPGSLGRLEDLSVQLAGITGQVCNTVEKRRILVFCADNGVVEEGVSITPQSVTLSQTINLTRAKTGASVLAKHFGDELTVVDMGINAEYSCPGVLNMRLGSGTRNLRKEDAMTREQAVQGILSGIALAEQAKKDGVKLLGTGEMGIGNTTTSSAMLAAFTGASPEEVTGRGGGMTDSGFERKKEVIREALSARRADPNDALDVLAKLGGFDIAGMTGAFLGAAICRLPIVIDGFISAVSALTAVKLWPGVRDFLIPSHASYERGYHLAMEAMDLKPMLLMNMRLGEGSGCSLAFQIVEAACAVMNDMASFDEAEINDEYIREFKKQKGSF